VAIAIGYSIRTLHICISIINLKKNQMKQKIILVLLMSILFKYMSAQLVPNGGFEVNTGCPSTFGQFNLVTDWRNPSVCGEDGRATPDYYHGCSTPTTMGVPTHICGTLADNSTGQAYAAIVSLEQERTIGGGWEPSWHEYIQCRLTSPLETGRTYRLRFFVAFNNTANLHTEIGYIISNNPIDQTCSDAIVSPLPTDATRMTGAWV
jgi:hypothetical protein